MKKTLIIAEAGVNHNGSIQSAKLLVDAAVEAGVDFVKFQTFKAENLVSLTAQKAEYQNNNTRTIESQFQMLKKLELSEHDHLALVDYCEKKGVKFLSTGFDLASLDFLKGLGIGLFKIPSGEITNLPYLKKVAELAEEIIISTGMCTMKEIEDALAVLQASSPNTPITILHCNTEYPTPFEDVNLRAMHSISATFGFPVGYSDHTLGIEVPIAAVALGAVIIEKHFTLDRTLPGPDHAASLEPAELRAMVSGIRNIEAALGSSIKSPSSSELKNIKVARKSIHIVKDLFEGDIIAESDLVMLRPGDGISPMRVAEVIGRRLAANLAGGSQLNWGDLQK